MKLENATKLLRKSFDSIVANGRGYVLAGGSTEFDELQKQFSSTEKFMVCKSKPS